MSLYRKYRPQKFADLVGEDHIRDTLLLAVRENRIGHAYLFSGLRGTGKTTVARLLAKAANCEKRDELNKSGSGEPCSECRSCKEITSAKSLDIVEIDAASNRGIDEIRELRDRVKFAPTSGKYKVFIIDEVHMLTMPAFNALLKTLEEPPVHAIFILATTEAQKIPATILSRVQRFDFRRISKADIIKNLKIIAGSEKLKVTDEALEAIAVAADGSCRDSISILEQVASNLTEISIESVRSSLGLARSEEIIEMIKLIASNKRQEAIAVVAEFILAGVEANQIVKEIIEVLRQTLLIKISSGDVSFDQTAERIAELTSLAEKFSASELNKLLSIFIEAGQLMKDSPIRTLPIEMGIIESAALLEVQSSKLPTGSAETRKVQNDNSKLKIEEAEKPLPEKPKVQISNEVQNPKTEIKPEEIVEENLKSKIQISSEDQSSKSEITIEQLNNEAIEVLDEAAWKNILEKTKEHNHTLSALLRDAKPEGVVDDQIILSVRFKFHHDKILEVKNRAVLEQIASDILGRKCLIKCQVQDKKQVASSKKQGGEQAEDLEKATKEMFEVE
ncbi:MAG: DNA polymerase III subunit gamma/tau [Candidatus Berkelbacteria bacterium]